MIKHQGKISDLRVRAAEVFNENAYSTSQVYDVHVGIGHTRWATHGERVLRGLCLAGVLPKHTVGSVGWFKLMKRGGGFLILHILHSHCVAAWWLVLEWCVVWPLEKTAAIQQLRLWLLACTTSPTAFSARRQTPSSRELSSLSF